MLLLLKNVLAKRLSLLLLKRWVMHERTIRLLLRSSRMLISALCWLLLMRLRLLRLLLLLLVTWHQYRIAQARIHHVRMRQHFFLISGVIRFVGLTVTAWVAECCCCCCHGWMRRRRTHRCRVRCTRSNRLWRLMIGCCCRQWLLLLLLFFTLWRRRSLFYTFGR